MAEYVTSIALGTWDERSTLDFQPVNNRLKDGKRYNAFGVAISQAGDPAETRRPYRIEEIGSTSYVMYDDDANGPVPIYKTSEV